MHLEPGGLRGRLPVLRNRRARVRARSVRCGDRRPGPRRRAPPLGRWPAVDQCRVHGDGRAAAQPRSGAGRDRGPERPASVRARRPPHHGIDLGRGPRHPPPHRARSTVHAGDLAPRRPRPVARRARAAQPALAGGRGGGRGARPRSRHRPADQLRGHDDRRRERHAGRCRRHRRAAPRGPRARQPDPDEPGRPHALDGQPDAGHRGVRGDPARGGIGTTIRRNRGQEVGAACGQLAAERAGEPPAPAVARRRARLVAESAAALLGERSHEPVPAGVGD